MNNSHEISFFFLVFDTITIYLFLSKIQHCDYTETGESPLSPLSGQVQSFMVISERSFVGPSPFASRFGKEIG